MRTLIVNSIRASLLLFLAGAGWSQSLPPGTPVVTGAEVDASVTVDPDAGIFTYSFSVTNSSSSVGSLTNFDVDIATTAGGIPLSSDGLTNSATGYLHLISMNNVAELGASIIPVGFKSQPLGWKGSVDSEGLAGWFPGLSPAVKIAPGHSMGGFVIASRGVPGIRIFAVSSFVDPAVLFPVTGDESDEEMIRINAQAEAAARASGFNGMTIGPVSPPSLTDPVQLLDFLISLKHQAASRDWFFGPGAAGIVKSLDAKLDAAKESAGRGDNRAAANQLEAFINGLDAQKGKHLNDNAYFLLKPNAQFIIGKLKP